MTSAASPPSHASWQAFRRRVDERIATEIAEERRQSECERERVIAILRQVVDEVRSHGACGRVWLFGSFAWGQPGARSDVDLLVEASSDALAERVSQSVGREVHAIRLREAPESLVRRATTDGMVL